MKALDIHDIGIFSSLTEKALRPVIVTHLKPDGDAFGSSMAMYHFLVKCGKTDTRVVLNNPYPAPVGFLADEESVKDIIICENSRDDAFRATSESDLIICLDCNSFSRTDMLEDVLKESKAPKVLIDHHIGPDTGQFTICFSDIEVSSASELLFHILMAMPQIGSDASALPLRASEALMTGMTTDTNNFANSTYPSTLAMASALISAGVDRDMILGNLFQHFGENRLRLMGHVLKDLLKITGDGVAYVILDRETQLQYHLSEGDTEGFVNLPLSIGKVVMSIMIKEDEGKARVSIRSKRGISANRCAREHFNGGGHENASGGSLFFGKDIDSISQAGDYVKEHTHIFMTGEK